MLRRALQCLQRSYPIPIATRQHIKYAQVAGRYQIIRTMSTKDHTKAREDGIYNNVLTVSGAPLTVRRGLPEDHDAILAVDATSGAYDSGDYLYGKLRSFLGDPLRLSWVAESKGRLVSEFEIIIIYY